MCGAERTTSAPPQVTCGICKSSNPATAALCTTCGVTLGAPRTPKSSIIPTTPATQHYPAPTTAIDQSPAKRSTTATVPAPSPAATPVRAPSTTATNVPSSASVSAAAVAAQQQRLREEEQRKAQQQQAAAAAASAPPAGPRSSPTVKRRDDDDLPEGIPVNKNAVGGVPGSVSPAQSPGFFGRLWGGSAPANAPPTPSTHHQPPPPPPVSAKRGPQLPSHHGAPAKVSQTAMQTLPPSGVHNTGSLPSAGPNRQQQPPAKGGKRVTTQAPPQRGGPPVNTQKPPSAAPLRSRGHQRMPSNKDGTIQRLWPLEDDVRNRMIDYHQQNEIRCLIQHYAEQAQRSIANSIPKTIATSIEQVTKKTIPSDLAPRMKKRWQADQVASELDEDQFHRWSQLITNELTPLVVRTLKYESAGDTLLLAFQDFAAVCAETDPSGGYSDQFVRETVDVHQGVNQGVNILPQSALAAFVEPIITSLSPPALACLDDCFQSVSIMIAAAIKEVYRESPWFMSCLLDECVALLAIVQQSTGRELTDLISAEARYLFPAPASNFSRRPCEAPMGGCGMCKGSGICPACQGCICAACDWFRRIPAIGDSDSDDDSDGDDDEDDGGRENKDGHGERKRPTRRDRPVGKDGAGWVDGRFEFKLIPGDQWKVVNEETIRPNTDQLRWKEYAIEERIRSWGDNPSKPTQEYGDWVREHARAGHTIVVIHAGRHGYIGQGSRGAASSDSFLTVRSAYGPNGWKEGQLMRCFHEDTAKGKRVIWVHAFEAPLSQSTPVIFDVLLNDCHHVMGGEMHALRGRTSIIRVRGFWFNASIMGSPSAATLPSLPAI